MHLSFYREFRPKTFDQVIGQPHIVSALRNQVESGQIGHAYLFTGTRGTGKTSCAKIFAKAINCENPQKGSPCGKCATCAALDQPNNVDVLEIDAASNNGVDEIRALREKVKYPPVHGKYKVYIIDEVHMLTDSAFNALLKTLEEPPTHAVFILATTEVYKLPATILSRCMRFDFRLVGKADLEKQVRYVFDQSGIIADDKSVEAIAIAGEGSVRDTLSVADCVVAFGGKEITIDKTLQILGTSDLDTTINLARAILNKDLGEVLSTINEVCLSGKNLGAFGKEMTVLFKNLIVLKSCKNAKEILAVPQDIYEKLQDLSKKADTNTLLSFMQKFSSVESELKYAISPRTLIELTSLECASLDDVKKN